MPRGGARPGAGRKSKREKYSGPINRAEKRIADRLPALIDNMMVLADGVRVQEVSADGELEVFVRPPDREANRYLIDRILGKPTERQEVSGEDGGPLKIVVEYADGLPEAPPAAPESAADPERDSTV